MKKEENEVKNLKIALTGISLFFILLFLIFMQVIRDQSIKIIELESYREADRIVNSQQKWDILYLNNSDSKIKEEMQSLKWKITVQNIQTWMALQTKDKAESVVKLSEKSDFSCLGENFDTSFDKLNRFTFDFGNGTAVIFDTSGKNVTYTCFKEWVLYDCEDVCSDQYNPENSGNRK